MVPSVMKYVEIWEVCSRQVHAETSMDFQRKSGHFTITCMYCMSIKIHCTVWLLAKMDSFSYNFKLGRYKMLKPWKSLELNMYSRKEVMELNMRAASSVSPFIHDILLIFSLSLSPRSSWMNWALTRASSRPSVSTTCTHSPPCCTRTVGGAVWTATRPLLLNMTWTKTWTWATTTTTQRSPLMFPWARTSPRATFILVTWDRWTYSYNTIL